QYYLQTQEQFFVLHNTVIAKRPTDGKYTFPDSAGVIRNVIV
ncbi:18783_t:CDS:2, partial [Rhizophagus irregularis]